MIRVVRRHDDGGPLRRKRRDHRFGQSVVSRSIFASGSSSKERTSGFRARAQQPSLTRCASPPERSRAFPVTELRPTTSSALSIRCRCSSPGSPDLQTKRHVVMDRAPEDRRLMQRRDLPAIFLPRNRDPSRPASGMKISPEVGGAREPECSRGALPRPVRAGQRVEARPSAIVNSSMSRATFDP